MLVHVRQRKTDEKADHSYALIDKSTNRRRKIALYKPTMWNSCVNQKSMENWKASIFRLLFSFSNLYEPKIPFSVKLLIGNIAEKCKKALIGLRSGCNKRRG